MFEHILIVCTANICRSPMGEALLRRRLGARAVVVSAGTRALAGQPADERVRELLLEQGLDLSTHRARSVQPDLLRWADLILAMEHQHLQAIHRLDATARGKSFLLGHWLGDHEIADPYLGPPEVYANTLSEMERALASWLPKLGGQVR
ncbi:arsenate reductase/protein-tyrosine-phosphatase family protein [Allochromatium vinosum]|uniref:arsenate reductase/protein-tyrosine-phosphatase family protein n=1 Tax=Allochromatium vinosum TaxID=1049 RepID=UPI0019036251|nr:hypothetical protein [Allochromatium vinosum]